MSRQELILVVDDQEDMTELMAFNLTEAGFRVALASDGIDAVQQASIAPPDLIVVDLILPEINGFSLCEFFRKNPATARVPIIMVSGWDYQLARELSFEAGANEYVTKPFSPRELVSRIKTLLAIRQPQPGTES